MNKEPKKYHLFCNACGERFEAKRADARTCSPGCRLAISNLGKLIKAQENLSPEDKAKYEEVSLKVVAKESNVIKNLIIKKHDNDGPIVLPDAVIKQVNAAKEEKKLEKVAAQGAKVQKPKKAPKTRKNDKHLIPGKKTADGLPAKKKKGGKK